jgi:type IV secretion system protein VirB10
MSVPQPRGAAPDAPAASSTQQVQEAAAAGMARLPPTSAQQNRRWLDNQATAEPRTPLRPVPLSSPFTLFEGTVIPAVLITEVNSDLPGLVSAQVTQDVYGGVSGEQLLIPKGTRLVGEYNGELRPGQQRVLAAFSRLIYPSGASVSLLGMPAADAQGRAGLEDQVDNHFFRIFGRSFIVAGLAWALQRNGNPSTVVVVPGTGAGGHAHRGCWTGTGRYRPGNP